MFGSVCGFDRSVTIDEVTGHPAAISTSPGDHICVFHRGPSERDGVIVPFLEEGLRAGDPCVCVLPHPDHDHLRGALTDSGLVDLLDSGDFYLSSGSFVAQHALDNWNDWCGAASAGQGPATCVRTVSDMSWFEHRFVRTIDELVRYEVCAGSFTAKYPAISLCFYDLDRFEGSVLIPVLRAHDKAFFSGMLFENPYLTGPRRAGQRSEP